MNTSERFFRIYSNPSPAYMSSGKMKYDIGMKHPKRIFPAFVAMFIIEGCLFFKEGGKRYELKKGQWYIQTPGIRHLGYKPCYEKTSFYFIHFMPLDKWEMRNSADPLDIKHMGVHNIDLGGGIRVPRYYIDIPACGDFSVNGWKAYFEELNRYRRSANELAAQSQFLKVLNLIANKAGRDSGSNSNSRLVSEICTFIKENYSKSMYIKELADIFHYSPDYITRCFKKELGMTPSEYMFQLRMEHAKELLTNTTMPVQKIGFMVGYKDLSVFSHVFKKYHGISPEHFRRKIFGV